MIDWGKVITVEDKQLEREKSLRAQRDAELAKTDWLILRHRDEQELGLPSTLGSNGYQDLMEYRQLLRDWTDVVGWSHTPIPIKEL